MPRTGLSPEDLRAAVLDAAEAVIRRHGAGKARLVDVAKLIGVNHAVLYRLFPDKAALMDGVSQRWLRRIEARLALVAAMDTPVPVRIREWFATLHRMKREKVSADPELYAAFDMAAMQTRPFVADHVRIIGEQLLALSAEGVETGDFAGRAPERIAAILFDATLSFHHPRLVAQHLGADRETELGDLIGTLMAGLARDASAVP